MSNDTLLKEWKQLKSGTDIRGVAMSEPGGEAVTLTDEAVYRMAMGFACWLNRRLTKERFTVAVGARFPPLRRAHKEAGDCRSDGRWLCGEGLRFVLNACHVYDDGAARL